MFLDLLKYRRGGRILSSQELGVFMGPQFTEYCQRRELISSLEQTPYWGRVKADSFMEEAEQLVGVLLTLSKVRRIQTCQKCNLQHHCLFGAHIAVARLDDTTYPDKLVHEDCPDPPSSGLISLVGYGADYLNKLFQNVVQAGFLGGAAKLPEGDFLEAILPQGVNIPMDPKVEEELKKILGAGAGGTQNDEDGSGGRVFGGGGPGGKGKSQSTFTGSSFLGAVEQVAGRLDPRILTILDIITFIEGALNTHEDTQRNRTPTPADDEDVTTIHDISQAVDALPREQAMDDDVFFQKIADGTLMVNEHQEHVGRPLLYILVDVSGSMMDQISVQAAKKRGGWTLSKGGFASAFSLAFLNDINTKNGVAYFRTFAGGPGKLYTAKTDAGFSHIGRIIGLADFNGGSTAIDLALKQAVKDIKKARLDQDLELGRAKILLLTDAEQGLHPEDLPDFQDTELHVIQMSDATYYMNTEDWTDDTLFNAATSYSIMNSATADLADIVTTVKGRD